MAAQKLAGADLAQTPAAFIKAYGGTQRDEHSVAVSVSDSPFDSATLSWDPSGTFITQVVLAARNGTDTEPLIQELKPHLGLAFVSSKSSSGAEYVGSASLELSSNGDSFGFKSPPGEGQAEWQPRARALWKVLANVGLGSQQQLGFGERELLMGYRFGAFAEVDPGVVVDQAVAHVRQRFPGAFPEKLIDLELSVECDHPWFARVVLAWENEQGARLDKVTLMSRPIHSDLQDPAGIIRCLEPLLGSPKVWVTDHLEQKKSYEWTGPAYGGGARMSRGLITFELPHTPRAKSRLRAIVSTLDRCGR